MNNSKTQTFEQYEQSKKEVLLAAIAAIAKILTHMVDILTNDESYAQPERCKAFVADQKPLTIDACTLCCTRLKEAGYIAQNTKNDTLQKILNGDNHTSYTAPCQPTIVWMGSRNALHCFIQQLVEQEFIRPADGEELWRSASFFFVDKKGNSIDRGKLMHIHKGRVGDKTNEKIATLVQGLDDFF